MAGFDIAAPPWRYVSMGFYARKRIMERGEATNRARDLTLAGHDLLLRVFGLGRRQIENGAHSLHSINLK